MPPIMGAAAFLMAEYTARSPYSTYCSSKQSFRLFLYFSGAFTSQYIWKPKEAGLKGLLLRSICRSSSRRCSAKELYLLVPLIVTGHLHISTVPVPWQMRR